jgi:hypothetical protein
VDEADPPPADPGPRAQTLFPGLPGAGQRSVEIVATVGEAGTRRQVMFLVAPDDEAVGTFETAFRHCGDLDGFEISVRRPGPL